MFMSVRSSVETIKPFDRIHGRSFAVPNIFVVSETGDLISTHTPESTSTEIEISHLLASPHLEHRTLHQAIKRGDVQLITGYGHEKESHPGDYTTGNPIFSHPCLSIDQTTTQQTLQEDIVVPAVGLEDLGFTEPGGMVFMDTENHLIKPASPQDLLDILDVASNHTMSHTIPSSFGQPYSSPSMHKTTNTFSDKDLINNNIATAPSASPSQPIAREWNINQPIGLGNGYSHEQGYFGAYTKSLSGGYNDDFSYGHSTGLVGPDKNHAAERDADVKSFERYDFEGGMHAIVV